MLFQIHYGDHPIAGQINNLWEIALFGNFFKGSDKQILDRN